MGADPIVTQEDEYDEDGRFAWDMIRLTPSEIELLCDHADAGEYAAAEKVVDAAEDRMFGFTQ